MGRYSQDMPNMNISKTDGERLKDFRKSKNLSQEEFAADTNLSRKIIGQMENNEAPITTKTKKILLKEYRFDFDTNSYVSEEDNGFGRINMEMGLPEMFSMIVEMRAEISAHTSALAEVLSKQTGESSTKFFEEFQAVYRLKLRTLKTGLRERRVLL